MIYHIITLVLNLTRHFRPFTGVKHLALHCKENVSLGLSLQKCKPYVWLTAVLIRNTIYMTYIIIFTIRFHSCHSFETTIMKFQLWWCIGDIFSALCRCHNYGPTLVSYKGLSFHASCQQKLLHRIT